MKKRNLLIIAGLTGIFAACQQTSNQESSGSSDTIISDTSVLSDDSATIGQKIDAGIDSAKVAGEEAKGELGQAADHAKEGAKNTGEKIKGDLNTAKDEVGEAAKAAGKDIKNAADKVGDKAKEGYNDVKDKFKKDDKKN